MIRLALAKADHSMECPVTIGTRLLLRRRRARLPTSAQLRELPLHAKRVKSLVLSKVRDLMNPTAKARLDELLRGLSTSPASAAPTLRVPLSHIDKLISADVLTPIPDDQLHLYNCMEYFCVVEERASGQRLRPIMWPKDFLKRSPYSSQFSLPSVSEYRKLPLSGSHAVAFDLEASFWQVLLPDNCLLAVIDEQGRAFHMKRLPYGIDAASEIMQLITLTLAGNAQTALNPWTNARTSVHIDNVLAVGDERAVSQWRQFFLDRCRHCGVQLNDEPGNAVSRCQTFVGLQLDFKAKTVCLKPSFTVPDATPTTAEEFERLMGKLIYAGTALALPLQSYLWAIKCYRRVLSRMAKVPSSWTAPLSLSNSVIRELHAWRDTVLQNQPVPVRLPTAIPNDGVTPDIIVAADATPSSYGGVIFEPGVLPEAFGGFFPHELRSINEAETLAAGILLLRFVERLQHKRVLLLIDNTSTIGRILRADRGGHLQPHRIADEIISIAHSNHFSIRVQYIESARNPADAISRQCPLDLELAKQIVEHAWGRKGTRAWGRVEARIAV